MKVLINIVNQPEMEKGTGVGKYTENLLHGFAALGLQEHFCLIMPSSLSHYVQTNFPTFQRIEMEKISLRSVPFWKKDFFTTFFTDRMGVYRAQHRLEHDILFHPYHALSVRMQGSKSIVLTVYDLFYKHYPHEHSFRMRLLPDRLYANMLRRAKLVITPSDYVKNDILKHFPKTDPDAIVVVGNPIRIDSGSIGSVDVKRPFILSVNALRPHKNMETLLRAFACIEHRIPHTLVLIGSTDNPQQQQVWERMVADSGAKRIRCTGYVDEATKNAYYTHADLFVSPSLFEGFGMTPVEAAWFGVPVLTVKKQAYLP